MLLQMSWPKHDRQIVLDDTITADNAYYFCLESGGFLAAAAAPSGDALGFHWHYPEPVMLNSCEEHVCIVDGETLTPGKQLPLRYGSQIQAGPYRLVVKMLPSDFTTAPISPASSFEWPDEVEPHELPDIESLLTHGGQYAGYLDEAETLHDQDVLKRLAFEYKRYLIWGEQGRDFINNVQHDELRLPARDSFLENVTERVKDKTMTECIFDQGSLIERVIDELMAINQLDISEDEEHPDLLALLAPGKVVKKEKRVVSELIFKELYKLGLDSYL